MEAIEAATHGQVENDLWFALRNGRLTSSRFWEIMHRCQSRDPRRLIKDIMDYGGQMQHVPPQICWGRENEDAAHICYTANRKACGEDVVVESTTGQRCDMLDEFYMQHVIPEILRGRIFKEYASLFEF